MNVQGLHMPLRVHSSLGESNPRALTTEPRTQCPQGPGAGTPQLSPSKHSGPSAENGSSSLGFFYINVGSSLQNVFSPHSLQNHFLN